MNQNIVNELEKLNHQLEALVVAIRLSRELAEEARQKLQALTQSHE